MKYTEVFIINSFTDEQSGLDLLKMTGISLLIYLFSVYLIPFFIFLVPSPLIVLYIKYGGKKALPGTLLFSLGVYFISGAQTAFIFFAYTAILTAGIGETVREKKSDGEIILTAGSGLILFSVLLYFFLRTFKDIDLLVSFQDMMEGLLTEDLIAQSGKDVIEGFKQLISQIIVLAPALVAVAGLFAAYINLVVPVHHLYKKKETERIPAYPKNIRLPRSFFVGTATTFIAAFLYKAADFPYGEEILLNLTGIYGALYAFDGFGVADYFLSKRTGKGLRVLVPVLVFLFGLTMIYSMIGIVDSVVDLRKRRRLK